MKELKLNAWDRERKEMFEVSNWHKGEPHNCITRLIGFNKTQTLFIGIDVDLLEYTTINDKDGQEVYEGHIVRQQLIGGDGQNEVPLDDMIFEGVVIWDSCGWSIDSMGDGRPEIGLIDGVILEILGNKFENPELLKA